MPSFIKRITVLSITSLLGITVYAQSEMSAFTATGRAGAATTFVSDYQCIGINPANLGWAPKNDKMLSFGLLQGGFSLYSEALIKSDLKASIRAGETEFTQAEKLQAAKDFTNAGFTANADVSWVGFAAQPSEEVGGFAFTIKERVQWYSEFSEELSEIIFLGYNADYFTHLIIESIDTAGLTQLDTVLNGASFDTAAVIKKGFNIAPKLFSEIMGESRLSLSWYREYNFSYGRKIMATDNMSLYGGVGVKYLAGIATLEARTSNGELEAYSALTPGIVDYGDSASAANPSTVEKGGLLPKAVGSGIGFDFGVSLIIGEKLKVGAALNDIGSITWNGNVYEASDDSLFDLTSGGINSYNIFANADDILGEDGAFDWNGVVEKKVSLPTNLRLGGSFAASDKFEAGVDMVIPVNDVAGNYGKALIALGVDITPLPWLRLSTGLATGGNYGFNLPIGMVVMIGEGSWEMGVASRDAVTFFSENRPTLSLSMGFLRFRF